ncbi:MAG TPA: hypothetical protein VGL42_11745 [Opitutaceae bacterium]|jgi:hypothetical protein
MKFTLLFLALAGSAFAARIMPAPLYIVPPTDLPRDFEGATVRVDLTVGADGIPRDIQPQGHVSRALAERLVPALAAWRFRPALVDGAPQSVRMEIPLQIVPGSTAPVTVTDPRPLLRAQ